MGVKVTKNFEDLAKIPLSTRQLMHEIGLMARERIIRRTLRGVDASGDRFQAYASGYAKAKALALGTATVNLQVSNRMLGGITETELTDKTVTLGFSD